jgi:hypothetical protein
MINQLALAIAALGIVAAFSAPNKPTKQPYGDIPTPTQSAYDLARSPLPAGQPQWSSGQCDDVRHIDGSRHLDPHCSP